MNNFKQHFQLFLERKYFSDIQTRLLAVMKQLKNQFNGLKELKIGDIFRLKLAANVYVTIKIMDDLPKDVLTINPSAHAYYDPNDKMITIGINQIYGYSSKALLNYIKINFPKQLEELIRHELSHAYEDLVTDVLGHTHYKTSDEVSTDSEEEYKNYINSTSELNAYLNQWLPSALKYDKNLLKLFKNKDLKNLTYSVVSILTRKPEFEYIADKNKKWFYKTIYTTLDHLISK